jgi:hypothetical protein
MSLASRISALASRIGLEVKTKIDATHPGLARAWVCFGYVGSQVVRASHNVASVTRTAAGRYRVTFANAMPDAELLLDGARPQQHQQRHAASWPSCDATSDQKTAQYVDISCATSVGSFSDSSEINLVVYR